MRTNSPNTVKLEVPAAVRSVMSSGAAVLSEQINPRAIRRRLQRLVRTPMTTEEQQMMDQLSKTVTALCEAIDPEHRHGPETDKIAEYGITTRKLSEELAHAVHGTNRTYQLNKARETLHHLGIVQPTNGGIIGSEDFPPAPNDD